MKASLLEVDLIQGVNDIKIKSVDDLIKASSSVGRKPYTLKVARNQETIEIKIRSVKKR